MTQAIIPGCEENPDPKDVIIIDHTKPMKEIPMDELKNNTDNIPESFKQFIATGSSVIETCRELVHVTEIQKNEILRLREENERLRKENAERTAEPLADYQTLKDFKGEMDAIHEEFDIPHDVDALRKDLQMAKSIKEAVEEFTDIDFGNEHAVSNIREALEEYHDMKEACDSNRVKPDELNEKLEELDAIKDVMDNKDISDADDLDNYLDEVADFQKYKKGFEELADFVEKLKEVIGSNGDDIPSTNVYDYD